MALAASYLRALRNVLLILVLLILLVISLIPLAVRHSVTYWLGQQGVDAEFSYLEVSPARGLIRVYGLEGTNAAGRGFRLDELTLGWRWLPLLDRQVVLTALAIKGVRLDAAIQGADQQQAWEVAGLYLPTLVTEPANSDELETKGGATPSWQVSLPELAIDDVKLCLYHLNLGSALRAECMALTHLELQGEQTALLQPNLTLELPNQLLLNELILQAPAEEQPWISVGQLQVDGIDLQHALAGGISIAALAVNEVQALALPTEQQSVFEGALQRVPEYQLQWQAFTVDGLQQSAKGVTVGPVAATGLQAYLVRLPEGQLQPQVSVAQRLDPWLALLMAPATGEQAEVASAPAGASLALALAGATLDGGELVWLDQQPASVVVEQVKQLRVSVGAADASAPQALTPVTVQATLGEFGALIANAEVQPFTNKINAQGEVTITALDLLPLSPYTEQVIGYRVKQGQVKNQLRFTIEDDQIDAVAELQLQKFYLDRLASADRTGTEGDSNLPIGTSLNLLRDDDNNIPLTLPITGEVGQPSVSPGHILGVVARKTLTQAVINYYSPFGLVTLAKAAVGVATGLNFEPLFFEPASAELSADSKAKLAKLVDLLNERSQLALVFCASANYSDWQPDADVKQVEDVPELTKTQREPLLRLARERNKRVKEWLISQGIKAEQVITCNPALNLRSLGAAEMTISL